jgi:monoamine oxidase
MQRRKFIVDTLTDLPILLLAPTLLASFGKEDENINPSGKTVVVIGGGISGLAAAIKLKEKGFTVIVLETQEIMINLKSIYGSSIPNPINFLRTKWGQNINSYGAYSYSTNGSTSADFDTLANEVHYKVFFAGERTERDYRGTVHGAYLSGIREADKIIDLQ